MNGRWDRAEWLTRVGWFVLTASSLLFALIVGEAIAQDYPLDSQEVREWVSALSGWAAALAAGFTLRYLERQTRLAERLRDEESRRSAARRLRVLNGLTSDVFEIRHQATAARYIAPQDGRIGTYRRLIPISSSTVDSEHLAEELSEMARVFNTLIREYNAVLDNSGRFHDLDTAAAKLSGCSTAIINRCTEEFGILRTAMN